MISVLIADDHTMFREGLRKVLEFDHAIEVVGEACDGAEAIQLAAKLKPQVLLLDMQMPKQTGLESLSEIARVAPRARTIFLTAYMETNEILEALRNGARGVVMKHQASNSLIGYINAVMAGDYCVGAEVVHNLQDYLARLDGEARRLRFGLTDRELEVVSAVMAGCSNKEMAKALHISDDTVKHHLYKIFDKTGVSSRLELALFAKNHKMPLKG